MSDTIAAVSTARGKGGIAVIRISGDDAFSVALSMLESPHLSREGLKYRHSYYAKILSADSAAIVDEGMAVFFRAPHSFTGEDVVEISCHGGVAVTEEVLSSALSHGARSAKAGEFTRRAFLSGKLSLTEAEAVGEIIEADTRERVMLASGAMRGNVSSAVGEIADGLLGVMTALYAAIDYPEEDVGDEGEREIRGVLEASLARVEKLLSTYSTGRAVSDGVRVAICGKPNVGKSSVFNLIVGEDSAIVTGIAGTTRDVLREKVSFGGVTLILSDTAGLHESGDEVERLGIGRARDAVASAELVIGVYDVSREYDGEDEEVTAILEEEARVKPVVVLYNKKDAESGKFDEGKLVGLAERGVKMISFSAKDGRGREELAEEIGRLFRDGRIDLSRDAVIWNSRQREILTRCREKLMLALDGARRGDPLDCVCTLTEGALAYLRETDGVSVREEIIDEIFKRFCVGK